MDYSRSRAGCRNSHICLASIIALVTIREPRIARERERLAEKPGGMLAGHVVDRAIEVEGVVVHPVHRIAHIVRVNGQAQATLNEFSGCHPSISGSSLM